MMDWRNKKVSESISIEELWSNAEKEFPLNPEEAVGKLVQGWAKALHSDVVSYTREENFCLFLIDLSHLMLKGMAVNLLMVVPPTINKRQEQEIYFALEKYADEIKAAQSLCFILFLQEEAPISKELHPELLDVVVLDGKALKKQFKAPKPSLHLFDRIIRQVSINRLCPFNSTRPAKGDMFVGRKEELRELVRELERGYVVNGSRRVGKSSLIRRAVEKLRQKKECQDRVFLFNCETWGSYESCARQIAHGIDYTKEFRIDRGVQNLLYLFEEQSNKSRRTLLLFFDEFDRVAEIDKMSGWKFLNVIHTAVERKWIRVVFVGYRNVSIIRDSKESPFFQSINNIRLPPLDDNDTVTLFIRPFQKVGFRVNNLDDIAKKILSASAGFPFIIQFYGEHLFHYLAPQKKMSISLSDIEEIERSFKFGDFFVRIFIENTLRDERLLALLYAYSTKENGSSWKENDFLEHTEKICIKLSIKDIHFACRNLILANIFKFEPSGYSFVFPILKNEILRHWPDLDLKKIYESGGLGN